MLSIIIPSCILQELNILTLEEYEVLRRFRGIILFQSIVKSVLFRHRLKRFYIFIRYLNI